MIWRLFWFAIAGGSGFAIDAGALLFLIRLGIDARLARVFSFGCALVTTWLINRSLAFGDRSKAASLAEFMHYALASGLAALLNLGIFTLLFTLGGAFAQWPVLPLAIATGISMSVNFWSYLKIVFRRKT